MTEIQVLRNLIASHGQCNITTSCVGCPIRVNICGVANSTPIIKDAWTKKILLSKLRLSQIAEANPELLLEEVL